MNIRQLKQLPPAVFIFLLGCVGIWLGVNQYASSLIYERRRLSNEQDALIELTKKWESQQKENTSDDAVVERIKQSWLQDYEKRIQEYRELFPIQTAIKEETFKKQISELSDIRNKLNLYIRSCNNIANKMNQSAK